MPKAKKEPIGMFGETPRVRIGKFSICKQSEGNIWVELDDGEGMSCRESVLEPYIKEFFLKHF